MSPTISLKGLSGRTYAFTVCDPEGPWNAYPGVYVFVRANHWPVYIGETENLAARDPGVRHAMWRQARAEGAVGVLARVNLDGEAARRREEADLIRAYDPRCNPQRRQSLAEIMGGRPGRPRLSVVEGGVGL